MDWKLKFQTAQEHALLKYDLSLCFSWNKAGAPERFLSELVSEYKFCPDELIEILKMSDGVCFNYYLICGSPGARYQSIAGLRKTWKSLFKDLLPFAVTPGSGVFFCSEAGEISLRYIDNQVGRVIAPTMEYFLGEVLMGPDYGKLFTKGFDEDEWTKFLRSQHWL